MKLMIEHIPEHDEVTRLYTFDELDEDIRNRLVRECAERHYNDWDGEYRDTLKALERLFGMKCVDWHVDGWTYGYNLYAEYDDYCHFRLEDAAEKDTDEQEEFGYLHLTGNRAMGKCWTLYGSDVVRGEYYHKRGVSRHSKVLFGGLHDGTCPLTGYCADNDALDPLWDMMEGKHAKNDTTIAGMIDQCFDSFFTAWQKDIEYTQTEDYFRENEMVDWYDADGNEVDVPEDATLADPPQTEVA